VTHDLEGADDLRPRRLPRAGSSCRGRESPVELAKPVRVPLPEPGQGLGARPLLVRQQDRDVGAPGAQVGQLPLDPGRVLLRPGDGDLELVRTPVTPVPGELSPVDLPSGEPVEPDHRSQAGERGGLVVHPGEERDGVAVPHEPPQPGAGPRQPDPADAATGGEHPAGVPQQGLELGRPQVGELRPC
jgi:hypothetical protein